MELAVNSLRLKLKDFSDSRQSSTKLSFYDELDAISNWVKKQQQKKEEHEEELISIENVRKVLIATTNGIENFNSEDSLETTRAVLDFISTVGELFGEPYGLVTEAVCSIIGTLLTESEPQQPSVVDQLAKAVHDELLHFNKRLQDQKYDGLRRRVSDQKSQLQAMKLGEKLDDPNLWNDYVQFMGELSSRFESPLPFKYEDNLTKDPDVADFVRAVVTYCEAYCCFMALLMAAKGKFAELGSEYKKVEDAVDRKMICQREDAKKKLSFLSEVRYLTFLGGLPYEGGKLTKIVVLSRNVRGKSLVEEVRGSLDLQEMQDLATVELAAKKVSRQSVKIRLDGHQIHPGNRVRRNPKTEELPEMMANVVYTKTSSSEQKTEGASEMAATVVYTKKSNSETKTGGPTAMVANVINTKMSHMVQFINETDFPMKIVSGSVGVSKSNLEFVQDIEPRSSCWKNAYLACRFSIGGYLIIYLNGILGSEDEPPTRNARIIEFALSSTLESVNIQDKTFNEFSRGQDTYDTMKKSAELTESLYWFDGRRHFMTRGEIVWPWGGRILSGGTIWRFIVQQFDPLVEEEFLEA